MKNKKLLVSALLGISTLAIGAVVGIAAAKKSGFRAYANPVEGEWHHYAERMPGVQPGIKEYWVQCGGNYQFTKPADVDIVDKDNQWDTSGFAADDDRYTYKCVKKIADSAITDSTADTAPYGVGAGFTSVQGKNFTATWYANAANIDLTNYDYVTFGLAHTVDYLYIFGGTGASQGDDIEGCISTNSNFCMWKDAWYYFTLERNAEGKWDAYVGKFAVAKRASASLRMADDQKSANNLNAILGLFNFGDPLPEGKLFSTEVYAGEKDQHHYVYDTSKITTVETGTCAVCGDVTERPAGALDFTANKYGAKLYNQTASSDVSDWTTDYNGGTFLSALSATKLSYLYYNWNVFQLHLPRIDFTKYKEVSFDLDSVLCNPTSPAGGSTWKIGFTEPSMVSFSSNVEGTLINGGKLTFTTYGNKVVAKISSFGLVTEMTHDILDADVMNGNDAVVLFVQCQFNSSSNAIQISNPSLVEKPKAADITDASIKEFYTEKQVRRVEQQDSWKIGNSNNEVGHADYFKFGNREAIHLSAHYDSVNDPDHFNYNSGWSEWRFAHVQAGLKSVTFTYLYEDTNLDTSNDGLDNSVHTMAQWYGAQYQPRVMELENDGQWHTITVSGDAYDTNFFVMKIYHFTGDIYISNIRYSSTMAPAQAADITDASIKEIQLHKQVRRVEQQEGWKAPVGLESDEYGFADYYKVGNRDAIHMSAHYDSIVEKDKFNYNSGWSEFRFAHAQTGLKSVTFSYLYEDSNSDTSNDGSGDVHTMAQWYGAAYQARTMTLVNDGQWHTITVTGEAYDTNCFVIKIFHFTGDIYISNIIYSTNESDVTDASIKEIQLTKQVRRVEQQDHWTFDADYADYGVESGHAEYVKCGTRDAIHFSAHYESTDQEYGYTSGWSEWRFTHAADPITSVTFDYCYTDSNSDTSNDGLDNNVHTMAQWYDSTKSISANGYLAVGMELVNDGDWHTITVTAVNPVLISHFVMKIFHFTGDIYISNLIYA